MRYDERKTGGWDLQQELRDEIIDLLKQEKYTEAKELVCKNRPRSLYKYRAGNEWDISALKTGKIWVSRASFLDDDEDGRVHLEDANEILSILDSIAVLEEKFKNPKYKRAVNTVFEDSKMNSAVCSLSEISDNEFMWENYANNAQGFCLEYDFEKLCKKIQGCLMPMPRVIPVSYSAKRPMKIEEFSNKMQPIVMGLYSKDRIGPNGEKWYEQEEWRIAGYTKTFGIGESDKGVLIDVPMPERIIFGENASDALKAEIQSWIKQEELKVQLEYR